MPCRDGGPSDAERELETKKDIAFLTAVTCLLAKSLCKVYNSKTIKNLIPKSAYTEAGIKEKELFMWLEEHRKQDEKRLQFEKQKNRNEKTRKKALKKLTDEERNVLGL